MFFSATTNACTLNQSGINGREWADIRENLLRKNGMIFMKVKETAHQQSTCSQGSDVRFGHFAWVINMKMSLYKNTRSLSDRSLLPFTVTLAHHFVLTPFFVKAFSQLDAVFRLVFLTSVATNDFFSIT